MSTLWEKQASARIHKPEEEAPKTTPKPAAKKPAAKKATKK